MRFALIIVALAVVSSATTVAGSRRLAQGIARAQGLNRAESQRNGDDISTQYNSEQAGEGSQ
jgi:hypothetical protein